MAEPQARAPPRGRGSGRGGRGGFSARGGRPRAPSGKDATAPSYEDEGDIGQLKKQYSSQLNSIREMFPDWTDEDLVFALQDTDGDLEATIERISEGNASQWGEVKKKTKDRTQKKDKEGHEGPVGKGSGRGQARGADAPRGRGRERGTERGRAGRSRGASAAVNGSKKPAPAEAAAAVPVTEDTTALEEAKAGSVSPDAASWEVVTPSEAVPPPADPLKSSKPDGTRSWASMLKPAAKPKPAPAPAKPKGAPVPPADPVAKEAAKEATKVPAAGEAEIGKPPAPVQTTGPGLSPSIPPSDPPREPTPSKDELTETNLEQVTDVSIPVASETVASNAGTNDPRSGATPIPGTQQPSGGRSSLGGFATTAQKAATSSGRSASHQRRVKEQQEAVVMPGHHSVDRAAVQFGSLGLGSEDVDDDREEAETRTQPPQHSPVAPRASLPPTQQAVSADMGATSRPPGLPMVSQPQSEAAASHAPSTNYGYNQFNNIYGSVSPGDTAAQAKQYDPLGQQHAGSQGYDNYPSHSQAGQQMPGQAAYSSAGSEYPSYYSSDNQRAYQNYYSYGQHVQPQPHETAAAQQKMGTGFGSANGDQASMGQTQGSAQNRFSAGNDGQPSGHSTPNPPAGHQQGPQSHQGGQGHGPAGGHGFPYGNHPYYNHPHYYSSYMNQVGHHSYGADRPPFDDVRRFDEYLTQTNQFGYGGGRHQGYNAGPYGGGGGGGAKYGQSHPYGAMSSQQSPFDPHSGSPANPGPYGQPQQHSGPGRDNSALGGSYGRAGSTQPSEGQSHSTSAFGGMSDVFNRSASGYSTQTSQQTASQQGAGGEEAARGGYNESGKIAGGPSPAPVQAGGARPGSGIGGGQSLPTTQGQSYGGYPSQMGMQGQQSQYGSGLGGLGGQHQGQSHQNSGYSQYGGGFGGNYYNSNTRGGWGGNYGH